MERGYYWAVLYGEEMVVKVMRDEIGEVLIDTFEYGYHYPHEFDSIDKTPIQWLTKISSDSI